MCFRLFSGVSPAFEQGALHFHFISILANCVGIRGSLHFMAALLGTGRDHKSTVLEEILKPKDTHESLLE